MEPLPPVLATPPEEETAGMPMFTVRWAHSRRRERLKSVVTQTAAWTVTGGVIAATIVCTAFLALGPAKTAALVRTAVNALPQSAGPVVDTVKATLSGW